jgi:hypothetical protein
MTTAEDVYGYLSSHPRQGFCDECLSKSLGLGTKPLKEALEPMLKLFHQEFYRGKGHCYACKTQKEITAFVA